MCPWLCRCAFPVLLSVSVSLLISLLSDCNRTYASLGQCLVIDPAAAAAGVGDHENTRGGRGLVGEKNLSWHCRTQQKTHSRNQALGENNPWGKDKIQTLIVTVLSLIFFFWCFSGHTHHPDFGDGTFLSALHPDGEWTHPKFVPSKVPFLQWEGGRSSLLAPSPPEENLVSELLPLEPLRGTEAGGALAVWRSAISHRWRRGQSVLNVRRYNVVRGRRTSSREMRKGHWRGNRK